MLERRMAYHDPRSPHGDDTGGAGSVRSSVVRPVGTNPQQVVVQPVDVREFYNQANDMQPSRVDPRYGLLNTQPAILRPDPMWAHRWPDMGPYRGMTAQPFAWESKQMDGLGEVTQEQRTRYQALRDRVRSLTRIIGELRAAAPDTDTLGRIGLIEGQLDRARSTLEMSGEAQDDELEMAMDDVGFELDQVEERLQALDSANGIVVEHEFPTGELLLGTALAAGLVFLVLRWSDRATRSEAF